MNTETENTATPPEPNQASNIQPVDFSFEAKKLHRKIAKLPKPLRDIINSSLDDSLPAKEIIQKLQASTDSLPYPITEVDISRWKSTGYMHYLSHQDHLDSIEASREAALEMVRTSNNLSLPQATLQVIASQCFEILAEFSPTAVKQKLAEDPLKYTSFLHVFARLTREIVHLEKFQETKAAKAQAEAAANNAQGKPVSEETKTQMLTGEMDRIFRRRDPRRAMVAQLLRASKAPAEPSQNSTPEVTQPPAEPPAPITHDPLPSASTAQILQENCLKCRTPLPPLTSEGKRPNEHCSNCNILLPPPGCCTQPSDDQCLNCCAPLPHRLPNGRRPLPSCHICGAGLGRELDEDIKKYAEE